MLVANKRHLHFKTIIMIMIEQRASACKTQAVPHKILLLEFEISYLTEWSLCFSKHHTDSIYICIVRESHY